MTGSRSCNDHRVAAAPRRDFACAAVPRAPPTLVPWSTPTGSTPSTTRTARVVEVRAYRGQRRAFVHREHLVNEDLFARALLLARAYRLHQLGSLDGYGPTELNKPQARRLADELGFLRTVVNDSLLEPHLTGMQEVADFCWRTSDDAWLLIEGP